MNSVMLSPAVDVAGRVVGDQVHPMPRPSGPWDGNRPPVVGDRVACGTVHAIAAFPESGHRIFVLEDDGGVTETSLVDFARAFAPRR